MSKREGKNVFDQDEELNALAEYLENARDWLLQLWLDGRLSPGEYELQFRRFMDARAALEHLRVIADDIEQPEVGDGFFSSKEQLDAQRLARRMLKKQEEL